MKGKDKIFIKNEKFIKAKISPPKFNNKDNNNQALITKHNKKDCITF